MINLYESMVADRDGTRDFRIRLDKKWGLIIIHVLIILKFHIQRQIPYFTLCRSGVISIKLKFPYTLIELSRDGPLYILRAKDYFLRVILFAVIDLLKSHSK